MSAVEGYKHALRSTYVSRDADECGKTYGLVDEDKADAAIAELEAERDEAMATMYHERGDKEQAEEDARGWAASFKQTEAALELVNRAFAASEAELAKCRGMLQLFVEEDFGYVPNSVKSDALIADLDRRWGELS